MDDGDLHSVPLIVAFVFNPWIFLLKGEGLILRSSSYFENPIAQMTNARQMI